MSSTCGGDPPDAGRRTGAAGGPAGGDGARRAPRPQPGRVAEVLGLRPEQVKALVYQARSSLISERTARDADCSEIREELATARGAALLKGKLRRHVRACPDCRTYADGVRRRRGAGAFLPLLPWVMLKLRALQDALSSAGTEQLTYAGGTTLGGTVAGAAIVAGGPIKAIAVKVAAGCSPARPFHRSRRPRPQHALRPPLRLGSTLVAKPAWLPLLGEEEPATSATPAAAEARSAAARATSPADSPPAARVFPRWAGSKVAPAPAATAAMGPAAGRSTRVRRRLRWHGAGQAAHHVTGTSVAAAGVGAAGNAGGGAADQGGQHGASQKGQHHSGGATGSAAATQSEGVEGETGSSSKAGTRREKAGPPPRKAGTAAATTRGPRAGRGNLRSPDRKKS